MQETAGRVGPGRRGGWGCVSGLLPSSLLPTSLLPHSWSAGLLVLAQVLNCPWQVCSGPVLGRAVCWGGDREAWTDGRPAPASDQGPGCRPPSALPPSQR